MKFKSVGRKILKLMEFFKLVLKNSAFFKLVLNNSWLISCLNSENIRFLRHCPGDFYSPLPNLNEILAKSDDLFNQSTKNINSINLNIDLQKELLKNFALFYDNMPFAEKESIESKFYLDNDYFGYGDAITLYSFLIHFRPKKIIEIGSGFSSIVMSETNKLFLGNEMDLTFIEPNPDRLLNLLDSENRKRCELIVKKVQDVPIDLFLHLSENDILFVDSSHVGKIGSDVIYILSKVLPQLNKGVIIHFHDIIWPFEYPKNWIEWGKAWNETYFIKSFLQYNEVFQIIYFNSYLEIHHKELINRKMPLVLKKPSNLWTVGNSSLWLRKVI